MQIAFGVILVSGICGGFLGKYALALPVALIHHHVSSRDLDEKMYDSYAQLSDDRDEVSQSEVQEVFINPTTPSDSKKYNKMEYLRYKKMLQRDKRYISYLTLCHFKICNMGGRKRTTRYFQMIRSMDDNDS